MRKILSLIFTLSFFLFTLSFDAYAIYDPLSVSNNRVGVHVLSPDELESATKLVNNDGEGEWGYITVPIQAGDRDQTKWTRFMKRAAELKVIPIIRVATYANGKSWVKPGSGDLIDFANFLNELPWPTQNRYVIIFNEVNRPDEYGGVVSPEEYADILNNAIDIFKSRSDKFFILPAGLDNAAPNTKGYIRHDVYLQRMYNQQKEIFNRIDGWTSHAYGNPGFTTSPALSGSNKADSFLYDLNLLKKYTKKKLPVFITETGWSNSLPKSTVASFYQYAFTHLWSNEQVVAITPFLLMAGTPPFDKFSLLSKGGQQTPAYDAIASFATKGQPKLEPLSTPTPTPSLVITSPPSEGGDQEGVLSASINNQSVLEKLFAWLNKFLFKEKETRTITIGDKTYQAEVVTSALDQQIGLSKYQILDHNKGMLFTSKEKAQRIFWMKDMKFDIDIVWIADQKVIGVSQGYFKSPLKLIYSPGKVDTVLEVNPKSGIKIGDKVVY